MAPIHDATRGRSMEEINKLLTQDASQLDAIDSADGRTPLIIASEGGFTDVVESLLGMGAALDIKDKRGATALYMACLRGHGKVVSLLLSKKADPTIRGEKGWTCLMAATAHPQIMRAILGGAKVACADDKDEWGCTALWWACYRGHAESARILLLDRQADASCLGLGRSPYDVARTHGHSTCLRVLEWYQQEIERGYLLEKARSLMDDEQLISKAPGKASAQTPEAERQARVEAAPNYLRNRVMKGDSLPVVEVAMGSKRKGQQERRAVIEHVLIGMKRDMYDELATMFLAPR